MYCSIHGNNSVLKNTTYYALLLCSATTSGAPSSCFCVQGKGALSNFNFNSFVVETFFNSHQSSKLTTCIFTWLQYGTTAIVNGTRWCHYVLYELLSYITGCVARCCWVIFIANRKSEETSDKWLKAKISHWWWPRKYSMNGWMHELLVQEAIKNTTLF